MPSQLRSSQHCVTAIPWSLVRLSKDALLQQCDDLARKVAKIDQDPLLNLKTLELLLTDLQCVEEEQVFITRKVYSQDLHRRCHSMHAERASLPQCQQVWAALTLELWLLRLTPDKIRTVSSLVCSSLSFCFTSTGRAFQYSVEAVCTSKLSQDLVLLSITSGIALLSGPNKTLWTDVNAQVNCSTRA